MTFLLNNHIDFIDGATNSERVLKSILVLSKFNMFYRLLNSTVKNEQKRRFELQSQSLRGEGRGVGDGGKSLTNKI